MNFKLPLQFFSKHCRHGKNQLLTLGASALLLVSVSVVAEDSIIATVNGQNIMSGQLEIAALQNNIKVEELTEEQRSLLIQALVNRELVLQQAKKEQYDQKQDVKNRIKALIDSYIASDYLATRAQDFAATEAQIREVYDKEIVAKAGQEYKARHILLKTEAEASKIIAQLEAGSDFEQLAKSQSLDAGSAVNGGDLGWFSKTDMVAPFAEAVATMNKGQLNTTPVQSDFGWHVIKLDDVRTAKVPEFDAVKENIEQLLMKLTLAEYVEKLSSNATIDIKK